MRRGFGLQTSLSKKARPRFGPRYSLRCACASRTHPSRTVTRARLRVFEERYCLQVVVPDVCQTLTLEVKQSETYALSRKMGVYAVHLSVVHTKWPRKRTQCHNIRQIKRKINIPCHISTTDICYIVPPKGKPVNLHVETFDQLALT
jgi:hypothetical protein